MHALAVAGIAAGAVALGYLGVSYLNRGRQLSDLTGDTSTRGPLAAVRSPPPGTARAGGVAGIGTASVPITDFVDITPDGPSRAPNPGTYSMDANGNVTYHPDNPVPPGDDGQLHYEH